MHTYTHIQIYNPKSPTILSTQARRAHIKQNIDQQYVAVLCSSSLFYPSMPGQQALPPSTVI